MILAIFGLLALCFVSSASAAGPACTVALDVNDSSIREVIGRTSPGMHGNKYGMEGGNVVRLPNGTLLAVTTEMPADPYAVATRIALWGSSDGESWERRSTVLTSSANFDGTDPRAALWGPMLVFDDDERCWWLVYVGYRAAPNNASGWFVNFAGNIWATRSATCGPDAVEFGPSANGSVILANPPGPFRPWYGHQGTDSFFPFKVGGRWLGFYGTAHNEKPSAFPAEFVVGLAGAGSLGGPWQRLPAGAPEVVNLTIGHTENPIVSRHVTEDGRGVLVAVFDFLNSQGEGFGVACAPESDPTSWELGHVVPVRGGARTPMGVLPRPGGPESDVDVYFTLQAGGFEAMKTARATIHVSVPGRG